MKQSKTVAVVVTILTLATACPPTTVNIAAGLKPNWTHTIQSPNFPNPYPPNTTCKWRITAPKVPGYGIYVIMDDFELEPCSDCDCDYLVSSTNGESGLGKAARHCSLKSHSYIKQLSLEQRIRSRELTHRGDSELWIQFQSDSSREFKGFQGQIRAVKRGSGDCTSFLDGRNGTIASPKYPLHYPSTQSCTWHIAVPDGLKVQLTFTAFNLENTKNDQDDCVNDYVEIREGVWGRYGQILGRFCGDVIPPPVTSPTN
ncbi:hypothetical protein QZH41_013054, partial [Actinostola sp. cb2023]